MSQLIPFNQSKAGGVPKKCLENTRTGFVSADHPNGIPAKYGSAWEAWEHTQQHPGEPPLGLDVPVFFSYIDEENGHIGVRLTSGSFWSDGVVYSSIPAYQANHLPIYVGWGESINDVKVIEEEEVTKAQADKISLYARLLQFLSVEQANSFNKSDTDYILANPDDNIGQLLEDIYKSPTWQDANSKKSAYEQGSSVAPTVTVNGKPYIPA